MSYGDSRSRNRGFARLPPALPEQSLRRAWRVEDADRFFADSLEHLFDHAREEYIVSVHLLKTVLAARRLYRQRPEAPSTEPMLAALNRFLNEPLKRKHVRRTMRQAMSFVDRDG